MPSSNLANAPLSPPKRYAADDLFLVASPPRQVTDFLLDRPVLKTQDDMSIGTMPRSDITYDCVVIGTGCAGASAAIARTMD